MDRWQRVGHHGGDVSPLQDTHEQFKDTSLPVCINYWRENTSKIGEVTETEPTTQEVRSLSHPQIYEQGVQGVFPNAAVKSNTQPTLTVNISHAH